MAGLFVQLDVEYPSDDEIIDAGPLAELLFIRGLCFIKRKTLDGNIRRAQLATVAGNIPQAAKHAQRLVDVGLWEATKDGWHCPSYLKRNPSKAEIEEVKDAQREMGLEGNHKRWHIGESGKPSPKCRLCRADRIAPPIAPPIGDSKRGPSPYTETEPETESYPESESYPDPTSSSSEVTPPADAMTDDERDFVNQLLNEIARTRTDARVRNPGARDDYLAKTVLDIHRKERDAIKAFLVERPHLRTAENLTLAAQVYNAARNAS